VGCNIRLVIELWLGAPPESLVTNPAVYLVIRTITHTGGVEWLGTENTAEAVTMIVATSSNHLLSSEHLSIAPGTSAQLSISSY